MLKLHQFVADLIVVGVVLAYATAFLALAAFAVLPSVAAIKYLFFTP